jgi:hypothetical protein
VDRHAGGAPRPGHDAGRGARRDRGGDGPGRSPTWPGASSGRRPPACLVAPAGGGPSKTLRIPAPR